MSHAAQLYLEYVQRTLTEDERGPNWHQPEWTEQEREEYEAWLDSLEQEQDQ